MNWLLVFLGGGIGSALRYGVTVASKKMFVTSFPVGTLLSNVISCILLALVLVYASRIDSMWKLFIITGICGGFSTFSTFSLETIELFRSGNYLFVTFNILLNLALCLGAIYIITKNSNSTL